MGPTCEQHLVLEEALNHPQQPVLHILAASLLTLLLPRDKKDKTPSETSVSRHQAHGILHTLFHPHIFLVTLSSSPIYKTGIPSSRKASQISTTLL